MCYVLQILISIPQSIGLFLLICNVEDSTSFSGKLPLYFIIHYHYIYIYIYIYLISTLNCCCCNCSQSYPPMHGEKIFFFFISVPIIQNPVRHIFWELINTWKLPPVQEVRQLKIVKGWEGFGCVIFSCTYFLWASVSGHY